MPTKHTVSVVIPCYNQGRYLAEAIESAIGQIPPPAQVIVVDDGSTDHTSLVAALYPELTCIRQVNRGLAAARNAGLEASSGEYVVFLDADDRLAEGALEAGVEALASHPDCAFVYGHVRLISADGSPLPRPPQLNIEHDHYLELLRHNYIWSPGAVMYRRDVFSSVGHFNPRVNASADYDLNIRIASRFPVHCHGGEVLEYRKHDANMTRDLAAMLKASVRVRRSHFKYVKGRKDLKAAVKQGIAGVQKDYGEKLVRAVGSQLRDRNFKKAITASLALLRYYPQGFAKHAGRRLLRARTSSRERAIKQT